MSEAPRVRLRDVTLDDADLLDAWAADPAVSGEFNDFGMVRGADRPRGAGPRTDAQRAQRPASSSSGSRWVEPIGGVGWHQVGYGPNPRIGRVEHRDRSCCRRRRGHGYGVEAQVLLRDLPVRAHRANRVEAQTDIENIAEQRALEKAGFVREGVARGSQFRAGAYHDLAHLLAAAGRSAWLSDRRVAGGSDRLRTLMLTRAGRVARADGHVGWFRSSGTTLAVTATR